MLFLGRDFHLKDQSGLRPFQKSQKSGFLLVKLVLLYWALYSISLFGVLGSLVSNYSDWKSG